MILGIISDTHDHIDHIDRAVELFKERKVDSVIHLGDFIVPSMVSRFKGLNFMGIYGNHDGERVKMGEMFDQIGAKSLGEFYVLKLDNLSIALYHGTILGLLDALISCGKYDVVCYGHSHASDIRIIGKTQVINPGTAHGFGERASIAFFDTTKKIVEIVDL